MYLDGLLVDTPLTGGLEPMLGASICAASPSWVFPAPAARHARRAQPSGFPLSLGHPLYRAGQDRGDQGADEARRQWFNKRKSVTAMLREVMYNQPVQLMDSDADNKVVDADLALQALGGDHVAFGYLTTTITVMDADRKRVEDKVRAVERWSMAWLHLHPRDPQCGRSLALQPAGPGLCQCPAATGPYAEPGPSDAAVLGLGRAGAQRSPQCPPLLRRGPADRRRSASPPMSAMSAIC
jgi:hypothetical protein